jgi:23S rRNA pseudouridine1911/1915/1917 synthase
MGFTPVTDIEVIFEDNHLIVVNKKPGQIVQGDKTGDTPLPELIKHYLKEKYQKPGNVFCGVIHRLDRPVSGICVFAKTSKALSRMNEIFHDRNVQKIYWAVVKNKPAVPQQKLVHWLVKNESTNKAKAHIKEVHGSKRAELEYSLIQSSDKYFLLEVLPHTGRHHQIRAQLAAMGCPIKGDLKYGSERSNPDGSIHLHARKLIFEHPVSKEKITLTAPVPQESLWKFFESATQNQD